MEVNARQSLLAFLIAAFAFQTWLVYTDSAGREMPLSQDAQRGRAVWHERNCQSCHQIYGFGGFLGPDLTNAIEQLSAERLESVLTLGAGQMPAFHLSPEERDALVQFLQEVGATGVGQLKLGEVVTPEALLAQVTEGLAAAEGSELSPAAARGRGIMIGQGCITCHLPNPESLHRAADLTTLARSSDRGSVLTILRDGMPGTAMPRLGLSPEEGEAVFEFLEWMSAHDAEIQAAFEGLSGGRELDFARIPWFEYE